MPLAFDATRTITGAIALTGLQIGLAQVDVTLEALVHGQAVTLGTDSESAVLDPTGDSTPVPFSSSRHRAANSSCRGAPSATKQSLAPEARMLSIAASASLE